MGGPSSIYFIYIFGGRIRNSEATTSGGGAQRPVWRVNEPEKTGARSARARTGAHARPKPTSSLCFSNQTDKGDETEGL
jgi:hypothetical protein